MAISSVQLSDDLDQPSDSLAKKLDRSKNYLVNQAVKEFLVKQSLEDSRWLDTLEALESVKSGNTIDEENVNSWFNTWGTGNRKAQPKL